MLTYKNVSGHTIGTLRKDFVENPKRIGLLIQNLSSNTLYFLGYRNEDILRSIEIDGSPYCDEVGASAAFSLKASAATSDIRIEEIIKV